MIRICKHTNSEFLFFDKFLIGTVTALPILYFRFLDVCTDLNSTIREQFIREHPAIYRVFKKIVSCIFYILLLYFWIIIFLYNNNYMLPQYTREFDRSFKIFRVVTIFDFRNSSKTNTVQIYGFCSLIFFISRCW